MYRNRSRLVSLACLALAITWTASCQRADSAGQPEATGRTPGPENTIAAAPATPEPGAAARIAVDPTAVKPATHGAGSMRVEVVPQYQQVLAGTRELNLLVRLVGTGEMPDKRPGLDLAVVIDRSGSMRGDKMRDVKSAALGLIDGLRDGDTATLISYSDDVTMHSVRLPVNEAGRASLRTALLGLEADGGTALGPGLMQALGVIESAPRDDMRLAHVLLFSDGLANVGEQRPEVLGARSAQAFSGGVSVSTLGVGVDYNEDLMTRLADQGGGRYHFIRNSEAIAGILDDEMKGLVATVARGIDMSVATAPGVEVGAIFGYPTSQDGKALHARVGSLGASQTREIVMSVRLPEIVPPRVSLGTLRVVFLDVAAGGAQRQIDVPLDAAVTADAAVARASEQRDVTVRVAEVQSAATLELAARAADRGDFAAANGSLDVQISNLQQQAAAAPSPKLSAQIVELEEAKAEMTEAQQSDEGRKGYSKKLKASAYRNLKK
jgi:Ca-activated chloride channel family protein